MADATGTPAPPAAGLRSPARAATGLPTAAGTPAGLAHWLQQYLVTEAASGAANTYLAKRRDVTLFLGYFREKLHSDDPDDWTKPVTTAFLRHLEDQAGRKATTVNRALATLSHAAGWVHERRPFLAGHPVKGLRELALDAPAWKGLTEVEVVRLPPG